MLIVAASGVSLIQQDIDTALSVAPVIACSDAIRLTGDRASAHVAADAPWWRAHPEYWDLSVRRFTCAPPYALIGCDISRIKAPSGCNSALLGLIVAVEVFSAKRILLLGVDLLNPGDHFFGKHPAGLRPSDQRRFDIFQRQFDHYRPKGVEIINCSPKTALTAYPQMRLADALLARAA